MRKKTTARSSANSRITILNAATKEFASKGFDGARVDRIAARSKVNKNLIYLYYGSKDKLFEAVLERAYIELRRRHDDETVKSLPPVQGIERFVRSTYRGFLDVPELIPLARSENVHRAVHLKNTDTIKDLYRRIPDTVGEVYKRGVDDGVFRPNVDVIELYVAIVSICSYHISNQFTLSVLLDTDMMTKERLAMREEHVVEFVLGFLRVG